MEATLLGKLHTLSAALQPFPLNTAYAESTLFTSLVGNFTSWQQPLLAGYALVIV
jgi:hypothetical protein